MRTLKLISLLSVSVALASTANAQFSVSGGGGAISDGGVTTTYPGPQPGGVTTSCVAVPGNVTSITSIEVDGFFHTWAGDLQMTLGDPNGVEHLVFWRPGFLNTSNFGTSGDFLGDYTFVESGGSSLPTSSNGLAINPGTYNQAFNSGGSLWVSGDNGINNTPMGSITGPVGDWCLNIYDWGGGDVGSFTGWTLNGTSGNNECYLIVGDRPGYDVINPDGTALPVNVNGVDAIYPVLQNSMPEFVIPQATAGTLGTNGNIIAGRSAADVYSVQVVMYNPDIFPNDPYHVTQTLLVAIDGWGNVTTRNVGTGTMSVWAQTGVNGNGENTVKFPFTMPQ